MSITSGTESEIQDGAPSAKFVYYVLEDQGPVPREELVELTRLPERTVDCAINDLEDAELVTQERDHYDARRVVYRLTEMKSKNAGEAAERRRLM